jgi:serine/threonine protein kinase
LNHPNIVTVFDTGEVDDMQFIAREYIEGVTPRTHLRANRLRVIPAIDIAVQIALALSLAYTCGIIHRDIKPENIMLRPNGMAKVLDFGVAQTNEESAFISGSITTEHTYQTQAGVLIGSLPYMSPEQARCQPVDARSDIFSFGALLYEMLTGSRAFPGGSRLLVLMEILYFEPAPARQLNKSVPVKLDSLVARCLAKSGERRPNSMDEVAVELIRIKERCILQAPSAC